MRLKSILLNDFRGITANVELGTSPSILVGENNSGKSTVLDAIRLASTNYIEGRSNLYASSSDFTHDSSGNRTSDTFSISLEFSDLDYQAAGRMVTCLSPSRGPGVALLTFTATIDSFGKIKVKWTGGDFANPDVEQFARTAVRHIYLPALRDANRDLRPGATNRLRNLVDAFTEADSADSQQLRDIMLDANKKLRDVKSVDAAAGALLDQLQSMTGKRAYKQVSDLKFSDPSYAKILSTLQTAIGDSEPLEVEESGLGYTNLLYMAVLLAVLKKSRDDLLYLLVVEEPEAHLHPQLQDLLMRHLSNFDSAQIQVVMSTHSPQLTSGVRLQNISLMAKASGGKRESHPLHRAELSTKQSGYLRRFFDATKSTMLFANGVILVEGIAEQLIIPELARRMGYSLEEYGVTVVNIGGVGFSHFIPLFGESGLPIRCSIISDSDPVLVDANSGEAEEEVTEFVISNTAKSLLSQESVNLHVFLAERTLEWDLAYQESNINYETLCGALAEVKPRKSQQLLSSFPVSSSEGWASEFLTSVKDSKGAFAMFLAQKLEGGDEEFAIPRYLKDAITWACGSGDDETPEELEQPEATQLTAKDVDFGEVDRE